MQEREKSDLTSKFLRVSGIRSLQTEIAGRSEFVPSLNVVTPSPGRPVHRRLPCTTSKPPSSTGRDLQMPETLPEFPRIHGANQETLLILLDIIIIIIISAG